MSTTPPPRRRAVTPPHRAVTPPHRHRHPATLAPAPLPRHAHITRTPRQQDSVLEGVSVDRQEFRDNAPRIRPGTSVTLETGGTTITQWGYLKILIKETYNKGDTFPLRDVYGKFEHKLQQKYPKNSHIRAAIQRSLQLLRSENIIRFIDNRGNYELID